MIASVPFALIFGAGAVEEKAQLVVSPQYGSLRLVFSDSSWQICQADRLLRSGTTQGAEVWYRPVQYNEPQTPSCMRCGTVRADLSVLSSPLPS